MRRFALSLFALALALGATQAARAVDLIEPGLKLPQSVDNKKRVALTLDACSGLTDDRILSVLVDQKVPATIFVTARWLKRNPQALAVLKAHPELFAVENHGAMHVPAVEVDTRIYGIKTAGSPAAVEAEVTGGADAIKAAGLPTPKWYRGATAEYTAASMKQIETLGFRIGGFSLNGDRGASLMAPAAEARIRNAKDGDVIIAHVNQPKRPAGQGVAAAILDLKKRGFEFVHLDNAVYAAPARREAKPAQAAHAAPAADAHPAGQPADQANDQPVSPAAEANGDAELQQLIDQADTPQTAPSGQLLPDAALQNGAPTLDQVSPAAPDGAGSNATPGAIILRPSVTSEQPPAN